MVCVNFTWLGTNISLLQLELYCCALGEVVQIPFFVYFCLLIHPAFMKVWFDSIEQFYDLDLASTIISTYLRKTFLCLSYYLKWKYLVWLTISCQKPFVFSVSVLFSNIYPKIELIFMVNKNKKKQNNNFYSKVIFKLLSWKIFFYYCLLNVNYWCFTAILWKFQKKKKKDQVDFVENLPSSDLPCRFLHNLHSFFLIKKKKRNYLIF